jgi:hypothetical protein
MRQLLCEDTAIVELCEAFPFLLLEFSQTSAKKSRPAVKVVLFTIRQFSLH